MNAETPIRGRELIEGGTAAQAGTGLLARLVGVRFRKVLDRVDAGLEQGSILAHFPDGTTRLLGGRSDGPAAEITIHDWRALVRLATGGSVGWYQAWEAGEWDSPDPVPIFDLFMRNATALGSTGRSKGPWRWIGRMLHFRRRNSRSRARQNIGAHYDLGNDFYAQWLDPTMSYSSALWQGLAPDAPLEEAQCRKVDALAARLKLKSGDSVLEIGCGWGFLARRFADASGAHVTGISLSDEQLAWARARAGEVTAGSVEFRHQDYRDVSERFDAIVSVEMVEAVGREYWPTWFDCLARCLKPGGRAAIQFITMRDDLFEAYAASVDFIQTYIFPGGILISESAFRRLAAERGLSWEDQVDFGLDYAETLRLWRDRFDAAVEDGRLPAGFDQRFVRLWRYYLMYCEGGFRGRGIDVSQVTLVKQG